jgi:DNA-binding CsgD family transcriptional regulator
LLVGDHFAGWGQYPKPKAGSLRITGGPSHGNWFNNVGRFAGMKGMGIRGDIVSIIEAIYSLEQPAENWINQILSAAAPALDSGLGIGGVLYRLGETPALKLDFITGRGVPEGWIEVGALVHTAPELQASLKLGYETMLCADLSDLQEITPRFEIMAAFYQKWAIGGGMLLNGMDITGKGASIHLFSHMPFRVSKSRWTLLAQIATHLATGYRLHRRLHAADGSAAVEAVLTPNGRVEHVEAAANSDLARASLQEAVECRTWSQGQARHDHPEKAVAVWRGLVTGRWTLIDQYERDGRRYILARENTPQIRKSAALSARESQAVSLASLGRSNKLIAYELGLAPSTIRVLIARAAKKLGARSRSELTTLFKKFPVTGA